MPAKVYSMDPLGFANARLQCSCSHAAPLSAGGSDQQGIHTEALNALLHNTPPMSQFTLVTYLAGSVGVQMVVRHHVRVANVLHRQPQQFRQP